MPRNFYPRPPRGGRPQKAYANIFKGVFLSTPSARRGDCPTCFRFYHFMDFYPRPPRGGRLSHRRQDRDGQISIHALREEGDLAAVAGHGPLYISIHALREEATKARDVQQITQSEFLSTPSARETDGAADEGSAPAIFYPRPPRGATFPLLRHWPMPRNFYPRPPRGGRQTFCTSALGSPYFIHALREEGDRADTEIHWAIFLSTPSARRATHAGVLRVLLQQISIHALREGATSLSSHLRRWMNDFIHALREEGDMVAHRLALAP